MNLNELLESVQEMQDHRRKKDASLKKPHISFHSFDYSLVPCTTIDCVNHLIGLSSTQYLDRLGNIFRFPHTIVDYFSVEEKETFLSRSKDAVNTYVFTEANVRSILVSDIALERDRVKLVLEGYTNVSHLPKKDEKRVVVLYKTIFTFQLERFFGVLTEDEMMLKALPSILELYSYRFSKAASLAEEFFLNNLLSKRSPLAEKEIKHALHAWYQEKELTFLHQDPWFDFNRYEFLLNKKQKKEVIEKLKKKCEDNYKLCLISEAPMRKINDLKRNIELLLRYQTKIESEE